MEHYQIARDHRVMAGDGVGSAMAQVGMGNTAFWAGNLGQALEHYEAAINDCERIGYRRGAAIALSNSAEVCLQLTEAKKALDRLYSAEAIMRRLGIRDLLSDTLRIKAQAHVLLSDTQAARTAAEEALELAREFSQDAVEKELETLMQQL